MKLTMLAPADYHVHLRQGDILRTVAPHTVETFCRALVMPNISPPVTTVTDVRLYKNAIQDTVGYCNDFDWLMTLYLTETTSVTDVEEARNDIHAVKLYPRGATTNSTYGVGLDKLDALDPVFSEMQNLDIVLSIHGEMPHAKAMSRERDFLAVLATLVTRYPRLRIVLEHISTAAAVKFIRKARNGVAATITAHHLALTVEDVIGDMLQPHHFCRPICKTEADRLALLDAVMKQGNDSLRFFFGSDSAPHLRAAKESGGAAGVFSSPVAMPLLVELIPDLVMLELFTSVVGDTFYGVPVKRLFLELKHSPWKVPLEYNGIVPFKAGQLLQWQTQGLVGKEN